MKILAISGSLRAGSYNTALLQAFSAAAADAHDVQLMSAAQLKAIPPYDPADDGETPPAAIVELRAAVLAADLLVIATPEYNGSIPGQLKHVFDWLSRPRSDAPIAGKHIAVLSASTGQYGGVWAQEDAVKIAKISGARVMDQRVAVPRAEHQLGSPDASPSSAVNNQIRVLLDAIAALPAPSADAASATTSD